MRPSLSWQKKAVLLLAVTLVFLSIVLATMAIREAERARLVGEQEAESVQRQAVALLVDSADSILSALERRVLRSVPPAIPAPGPDAMAAAARRILEDPENKALLSEIFILAAAGNITYPAARPLYLLPGEKAGLREIPAELTTQELWREGEDAEFKRGDAAAAAAAYERLLTRSARPELRPFILSRLGRCCQKAGNFPRAMTAFREIRIAGRPDLSSDGIPLELLAAIQIADIYLRVNRPVEAAGSFIGLYGDLLTAKWALTKGQFDFYRDHAEKGLRTVQGTLKARDIDDQWSRMTNGMASGLRRMGRLENIRQRIVPLIVPTRPIAPGSSTRFSRLSALQGEDLLLVSYCPLDENDVLGLVIDPGFLALRLLPAEPSLPVQKDGWLVRLEDESGRLVAGRELPSPRPQAETLSPSYAGAFNDNFPPWRIAVYQVGQDRSLRDFRARRAVYVLLVAVVITALALGGTLAIRSTGQEFELARLKSDFVSTVSHDFRTPLTSIRYLAEMLERGRVKDEVRKLEYYRTIGAESERLNRLVENILDFSKIEAGMKEFRMEETDVAALARDVAGRFLGQTAFKDVTLEAEIPPRLPAVSADPEALSRALLNLLDNAAKYSGEDPWIALRARAEADEVCLEVEDRGIGIGPAEQKRVFEKFYRSPAASSLRARGSGIGLTLVDHIVRAHCGRVMLESQPGRGTKVTIRLPVRSGRDNQEIENG